MSDRDAESRKKNILIADDIPTIRTVLNLSLQSPERKILLASNGLEDPETIISARQIFGLRRSSRIMMSQSHLRMASPAGGF